MNQDIIRQEFPQAEGLIYLNHAGVGPWPRRCARAVQEFAWENVHQGARDYPRWLAMEATLRGQLRTLINAPSASDIALLKNTSEALSFVAAGLGWAQGDNIVSSDEEFPSNRLVWEALEPHGVSLRQVALRADPGRPPEDALEAACDDRTRLLAISSVQYASGLRLDLERLGRFCRSRGILFCVDAIQSLGVLPFDVQAVDADFVMADGHKWLLGPEGLALFYCRPVLRERLRLTEFGWHMVEDVGNYDCKDWTPARSARRFECGSPNMLGTVALSASLSLLLEIGLEAVSKRIMSNISYALELIGNYSDVEIMTPADPLRRAGIVTFLPGDRDPQQLFQALRGRGVICALRAGRIRFSPHFYTDPSAIKQAVQWAFE